MVHAGRLRLEIDPSLFGEGLQIGGHGLNLPGSKKYDPFMPWVSKIRLDDGHVACDLFIYVDDGRVCAPSSK